MLQTSQIAADRSVAAARNVIHVGTIELRFNYSTFCVAAPTRRCERDAIVQMLQVPISRAYRSLRRCPWYAYDQRIPALAIAELGNRGDTAFLYHVGFWGPSPEVIGRSYYRPMGSRAWVPESASDPFVSAFGIDVLTDYLSEVKRLVLVDR